jgi:hypothetical protein
MKITFEQEGNSIFAVSQNVKYKGKMCDELMFAEIKEQKGDTVLGSLPFFMVHWEDSYSDGVYFPFEWQAKQYVLDNYSSHKPHINGKSYEIDED